jgi:enoyl-CoA hydratase
MSELVTYRLQDSIATIAMDDGKVNILSANMQSQLNRALDRAEADRAVVVLAGRTGAFSAGFDLPTLSGGGAPAANMVKGGFELALRLLAFPTPVVVACTGHALAMGSFLLLSADFRIGAAGSFKIGANEVAIGLTMPHFAIELCRHRLTPAHFQRAVIQAEIFAPEGAAAAGFLDEVVAADDVLRAANAKAAQLAKLNMPAHAATKLRVREHLLKSLRQSIDADDAAFRARA